LVACTANLARCDRDSLERVHRTRYARRVYGLTLLGDARPIEADALASVLGERRAVLPDGYVQLMTRWGPGWLCGVFELPDPSQPDGRFDLLQDTLRVRGLALRRSGQWAQLAEDELERGVVLGVDRFGRALFARTATDLVLLRPGGDVKPIGTFEELMASYLLGSDPRESPMSHRAEWDVELDVGVPPLYITTRWGAARAGFLEALASGDEERADAALQSVIAAEVALFALLELASHLAGPGGKHLAPELRASYAEQCFRMAKRRAPGVVGDAPIREIRLVLASGTELTPELSERATLLERPVGIFVGSVDPTERSLLDALAAQPDDVGTRLVYADHLEQRGELARAEALRAEASTAAPLADARERGFVAPPGFSPVDGAAQLREHLERWRADDPETSLDALVAHIEALHPTARQGYAMLLAQSDSWQFAAPAVAHLAREIGDVWPQLVLAIRSPHAGLAVQLLVRGKVRKAAPFLLAALRRPSESVTVLLAAAYAQLGKIDQALVDEFLPYFEPDAGPAQREAAFVLLKDSAADDRVFEGYLRYFCDAHPHSEHALKKRRKDPRILPALHEALDREEKASLRDGRNLAYTTSYGRLAKYLSRLGDARGKEASKRYQRFSRWGRGGYEEM
jgi:uncharacterized protein (TIGR02996 family)